MAPVDVPKGYKDGVSKRMENPLGIEPVVKSRLRVKKHRKR
jgi:hypothetical protein